MFGRRNKEEKERQKAEEQRKTLEAQKTKEVEDALKNRQKIRKKHGDRIREELTDSTAIDVTYSPSAKVVVSVYPDRIKLRSLTNSSLFATGLRGEKTIYLNKVTTVQLRKPSVTVGYIQFKVGGEGESRSSTYNAVTDENAVTFLQDQFVEFTRLRDIVEDLIQKQQLPGQTQNIGAEQLSVADELSKLAGLRDQGIITQAEFEQQKSKLLN